MATVYDEYIRAMHMGQKEKRKLESEGLSPYPSVFDDIIPNAGQYAAISLPIQDIPVDKIVGTKTKGRMNVFSASFLPIAEPDSEFAMKWMALCKAHLSDTGITDPIECYEYFGNFYVQEGNKRVSVLRYFGATHITAKVTRILPSDKSDPKAAAYYEFLDFYKATGIYDIQFKKQGDYEQLCAELGKKPGDAWSAVESQHFSSCYHFFKEVFNELGGEKQTFSPEDALLMFLRVYTFKQFSEMTKAEMKRALQTLWEDVRTSSEPEAIDVVKTAPDEEKSVIGKIFPINPRHLDVGFIYQRDGETGLWTRGHLTGAERLEETFSGSVNVKNYFHANTPDKVGDMIERAVSDGADVIFTTTPPMLSETLKAAQRYPKIRFFNCSANQPLASVRSYYCRTYEGKFITGIIAGALAKNDVVGYVGSYPILGVPASINAFAAGARMTNPRVKVILEWSCTEGDPVRALVEKGASVISNRDIPLPDIGYMDGGMYGTFTVRDDGSFEPLASPCWMWDKVYEQIIQSILVGTEKKARASAVNYWWGMDSGVIDVELTDAVPDGVRNLAKIMTERLKKGKLDPFMQRIASQSGDVLCDGKRKLSSLEILKMNTLAKAVEGRIPEYDELLPMSRELVREIGAQIVKIPPEAKV